MGYGYYTKPSQERYTAIPRPTGGGYVVRSPDGSLGQEVFIFLHKAKAVADAKQREIDAKSKRGPRLCLRCQDTFFSEGVHNRMCNRCRCSTSDDESSPFSFGAIHGRKRA